MGYTYEIGGCCDGCFEAGAVERGHFACSSPGRLLDLGPRYLGSELRDCGWIATIEMTAREIHESRSSAAPRVVSGSRRRRNATRRTNRIRQRAIVEARAERARTDFELWHKTMSGSAVSIGFLKRGSRDTVFLAAANDAYLADGLKIDYTLHIVDPRDYEDYPEPSLGAHNRIA